MAELIIEVDTLRSPTQRSLRGISVVDEQTAWLSGAKGTVMRSVDGGDHWIQVNAPDGDSLDFRDVHAFSDSTALVMSAGFPSRIYRTENAGLTWSLVHENLDSSAFMNSIAFSNEKQGLVFGDVLGGRHLVLQTWDAGKNWLRMDSNFLPKPLVVENGFAASGSCLAVNEEGLWAIALGGEQVRVFSSPDGKNWEAFETPMFAGKASRGAYSIAHGGNRFMAVGGDYLEVDSGRFAIQSLDGRNWVRCQSKLSGYRSVIDYAEPFALWLTAGTNGMEYSLDNGGTWVFIQNIELNTLQFAPNSSWAIGASAKGKIYKISFK